MTTIPLAWIAWTSLSAGGAAAVDPAATGPAGEGGEPWRVGEPLPALRLPTLDGAETLELSSLAGRKLLLVEFASW